MEALIIAVVLIPLIGTGIALLVVRSSRSRRDGLRSLFDPQIADPVAGTLTVTHAGVPSRHAQNAATTLVGVLHLPGQPPVPVQAHAMVPTAQWPQPGQDLPVVVERSDPNRLVVHWASVPSAAEQAMRVAEQMAAQQQGMGQQSMGQPRMGQHDTGQPGPGVTP
ncbi:hypothetical protein [Cellulomonas sp. NPDC089187]|uniref:hypothetical protein n=1 Tax=Cellulomonas sp. NPDC089187 TaxID=3154970 RepID=UPI00342A660D